MGKAHWWHKFGPVFVSEIREKCSERLRSAPQWQWHLDEIFLKINGK
jgi:putative transposase